MAPWVEARGSFMREVLGKKEGRCIFGKFLYVSLIKVVISRSRTHAINLRAVGQALPFGLTEAVMYQK